MQKSIHTDLNNNTDSLVINIFKKKHQTDQEELATQHCET
jgi:hypothetical protein